MKPLARLVGSIAAIYVILTLGACALQEQMIFHPVKSPPDLEERWQDQRILIASEGLELEAWWLDNPASDSPVTLLYFGGNAQDVLWIAEVMQRYDAGQLLLTRYRGYGRNPGRPGEAALRADAIAAFDRAAQELAPDPAAIVALGRSIGAGVAVQLAAERDLAGLVLVTPFDSLEAVARHHFPWLPVRWFMRHRFDLEAVAGRMDTPALLLAAAEDDIIPPRHAQRLHSLWGGPSRLESLPGAGHNDIEGHPDFYPLVNAFLRELGGKPPAPETGR